MKQFRIALTASVAIYLLGLLGLYFVPWHWFVSPETAYRLIIGKQLPIGVKAMAFGSQLNDNLLHIGYYWKFEHTPAGLELLLKQLNTGIEFEDYSGAVDYRRFDAIWMLPAFEEVFKTEIPQSSIGRGYEFDGNESRDDWLLVDKNGSISYLEWN